MTTLKPYSSCRDSGVEWLPAISRRWKFKKLDHMARGIEPMQVYRTRLISDVVTGKLVVRGVNLGEMPESGATPFSVDEPASEDTNDLDEPNGQCAAPA